MIPALLATALPLLPKIPALAQTIAGIFGKKLPKTVNDAIQLGSEVSGMLSKGQVSPEQQVAMEAAVMAHKETIMKLANERMQIENATRKDQMAATVALWGQEVNSQNKFVAETRPKILRQLFWACTLYAFTATFIIGGMSYLKVDTATIVSLVKWIGGSLFGTFSTAFIGYTTARTVDKRNPNTKDQDSIIGSLVKLAL